MNLDIAKAFTFPMEDQKWVAKLAIGGGLLLAGFITLIGWIFTVPVVLGYLVNMTRNVINGNPQPLPEWDNWGERWIEGVKVFVVSLVYYLPVIILRIVLTVPGSILASSSNNGVAATGGALNLVGGCLSFIVQIAISVVLPAAIARFAVSGNIADGFKFGEIFATVRQNIGMYIVIALMSTFVAGFIAGIGLIACLIGAAFTSFYAYLMTYHLYGQAYRNTQGAPLGYSQQPPMYGEPRPF
jgi:hypothetical protein